MGNFFDIKKSKKAEKIELSKYHDPANVIDNNAPLINETQVSIFPIPGRMSSRYIVLGRFTMNHAAYRIAILLIYFINVCLSILWLLGSSLLNRRNEEITKQKGTAHLANNSNGYLSVAESLKISKCNIKIIRLPMNLNKSTVL